MSDSPGQELLALMSQRPPGTPHRPKYRDPVTVALLNLPFVSYDRREALARKWDDVKPVNRVIRVLNWYASHDRNLLFFARLVVTMAPIVLSAYGVGVAWIVSSVVASMFIIEWLDRVRSEAERRQTKSEAKREYYREVERPRRKAQERELRRQLFEEQGSDDQSSNSGK